jgi:hypothetical protein
MEKVSRDIRRYFSKILRGKKINAKKERQLFERFGLGSYNYNANEGRGITSKCAYLKIPRMKGASHVIGYCPIKERLGLEGTDCLCVDDFPSHGETECSFYHLFQRRNEKRTNDVYIMGVGPDLEIPCYVRWAKRGDLVLSLHPHIEDDGCYFSRVNVFGISNFVNSRNSIPNEDVSRIKKNKHSNVVRFLRGKEDSFRDQLYKLRELGHFDSRIFGDDLLSFRRFSFL